MIRYPLAYNPILEYWGKIESGEEVVSNKVRTVYKKVVQDLANPGEYFYSPARGNHIIEFFENYLRTSRGNGNKTGQITLELWEKALLATAFGFVDIDGVRKYREVILIVGKKNGKSLLSSGVGLYLLVADQEKGPEIYAVATKKDQAKIIWQEAKRMVLQSAVLRKRIKPLVGELSSEDFNFGSFKPLASDSDTLDGLNVHGALFDEIQQWKNGRALFDIIADGITARTQPMIFVTSTAGTVRDDIYDQKYSEAERILDGYFDPNGYKDERTLPVIYELNERKDWVDESHWKEANPGLGTIKNLKTFREKVEKAKGNPALVKNLLCKEFNIRETSTESWLSKSVIDNQELFDILELKPKYGIGGVDLSETTDLTCATIIFKVPGSNKIYVEQMYWIPEDLFEKRIKEDKVPYDLWREGGWIRTCPGNKILFKDIVAWFKEMQDKKDIYLFRCGYDSWSAQYFVEDMKTTFGRVVMEPIIQGKKTLSAPMKALGADLEKKIIVYNNNPVLKWCLYNTRVDKDKNNNIQPAKNVSSLNRIDGTASLLDAYVTLDNNLEEYEAVI